MERKEVVVGGKVFDLGLKGLAEAINQDEPRTMELEVGPRVFQVGVMRQERALCFHQVGMTEIRNIIWQRFIVARVGWPPVRSLSCFTFVEEDI